MMLTEKLLSKVFVGTTLVVFLYKYNKKGVYDMLDLYVGLVVAGRRTCNPENTSVRLVPQVWRELVLADLEVLGYDADGKPVL